MVNDVEVEITFRNTDPALHQYIKASTYSPYFDVVQNTMLNRLEHSYPAHPDLTKYPVKYLIVSPRMFENDLQPFIQWKTKKGLKLLLAIPIRSAPRTALSEVGFNHNITRERLLILLPHFFLS